MIFKHHVPCSILCLFLLCGFPVSSRASEIIVTDIDAEDSYFPVVQYASQASGTNEILTFSRPEELLSRLRKIKPDFVLMVMRPETIDLNFAYDLLDTASRIDDDPFVDFCYGIITGRSPEATLSFMKETQAVRDDPGLIPGGAIDVLGPNGIDSSEVSIWPYAMTLPYLWRYKCKSLNHGMRGYPDDRLKDLEGYGIIHFGGHGIPDRIENGITAEQIGRVNLSHALFFNGACWTGVTHSYFDFRHGRIEKKVCKDPFCLRVLDKRPAAYFAAVHPDHGIPVYQEMERLFYTGASLGEVMKYTYDQVVLASRGMDCKLSKWKPGAPTPTTGRGKTELYGSAARLLYGDPRVKPIIEPVAPPYRADVEKTLEGLYVQAVMNNLLLRFTHMDTFSGDLCAESVPFNDRMYLQLNIPKDVSVGEVEIVSAKGRNGDLKHRLVAYALEEWRGKRILHVQIDFEATAYQVSPYRDKSSIVELLIQPKK